MNQLEIQYFYPLTEQIPLDLDYTPSIQYQNEKREELLSNCILISTGGNGTVWATINNLQPSFCIDIDQTPLTVVSKTKPNFFRRYLYKIMGLKWKAK